MVDFSYEPLTLTVKPGTEVIWRNTGVAPHTVTAKDGSFDSGLLKRADSFSQKFMTVGTYEYACTIHPAMVGKVVVSAEAAASAPAAKVPPGAAAQGSFVEIPKKAAVPAPTGGSLSILLGLSVVLVVLVTAASAVVVMLGAGRGARS